MQKMKLCEFSIGRTGRRRPMLYAYLFILLLNYTSSPVSAIQARTAVVAVSTGERCNRNSVDVGRTMDYLLDGYDRSELPHSAAVNVTIELHVQGVSTISERTGDFEINLMYSQIWNDERLSFRHRNICATNLTLKAQFRDRIWTPDTCIINSRESYVHKSPSVNTFVMLGADGLVWANYRMRVKAPCKMNLHIFPFDCQQCSLVFESYSFNSDEVRLEWDKRIPVTIMQPVELPDFSMTGWRTSVRRLPYPNGVWDRAEVTFTFKRRYGFYLFQTYFPTALTVISSWVCFFLDVRSASARLEQNGTFRSTEHRRAREATDDHQNIVQNRCRNRKSNSEEPNPQESREIANFENKNSRTFTQLNTTGLVPHENTLSSVIARDKDDDEESVERSMTPGSHVNSKHQRFPMKAGATATNNMALNCHPRSIGKRNQNTENAGSLAVSAEQFDAWAKLLFPLSYGVFNVVYWTMYLRQMEHW